MVVADPTPRPKRRPLVHRGQELHCTLAFEEEAFRAGHRVVAGLDEVGRGALCGPVLAGAVVLGPGFRWEGLDDSKRLTARARERWSDKIRAEAQAWALGEAGVAEIDRLNILRATHLAMRRALEGLGVAPDLVLVDGHEAAALPFPQRALVKGDALSASIAAASILAKVARDARMREADGAYPGYGLARNMGYGSADHRDALRRQGPSEWHRRSFAGTCERWLF